MTRGVFPVLAICAAALIAPAASPAFEPINSPWDTYYDLLALQGKVERPYLTIRQLSRNRWEAPGPGVDHPWSGMESLDREIVSGEAGSVHGHGVELFGSFNTAYPSGGNDGAMWQGKGVNGRFSTGVTGVLEAGGHQFQATLLPEIWGAQNLDFELVDSANVNTSAYSGDPDFGSIAPAIDNPQRFGDDPVIDYTTGESEARYSYGVFTIGAGTQTRWLGPARQYPLILSNNAGGYPYVDVGIYPWKTPLGTFETSAWWGRLETSDYFEVGDYGRHVFTSGLAAAYRPPFLDGLTIGVNRVVIAPWDALDRTVFVTNLDFEFHDSGYGEDEMGQHAGITMDWEFPEVGFNAYFEWVRNDFSPSTRATIISPEHSAAYTIGARQIIAMERSPSFFVVSGELVQLAHSKDYLINTIGMGPGNFYGHGSAISGYTHNGQVLGSWTGPGADAQYLGVDYYHTRGKVGLFVQRFQRNDDVIYFGDRQAGDLYRLDTEMSYGLRTFTQFGRFGISADLIYAKTYNWNYIRDSDKDNVYGALSLTYGF